MNIELGQKVIDTITGYTGIAIGRTVWLYGCVRVGVQAQGLTKDGKPIDAVWFDEGQLKPITVESEIASDAAFAVSTGGPRDQETQIRIEDSLASDYTGRR